MNFRQVLEVKPCPGSAIGRLVSDPQLNLCPLRRLGSL
jgi:hypothetical protein